MLLCNLTFRLCDTASPLTNRRFVITELAEVPHSGESLSSESSAEGAAKGAFVPHQSIRSLADKAGKVEAADMVTVHQTQFSHL